MIRATHGVHSGYYYYEALILNRNEEEKLNIDSPSPHFRVGWASRQAELEGPVGYDKFSFAFRDVGGTIHT